MYVIYRDNRKFNNKVFDSYEKARSYTRKWIRKNLGYVADDVSCDRIYHNPSFHFWGFSINKKVA